MGGKLSSAQSKSNQPDAHEVAESQKPELDPDLVEENLFPSDWKCDTKNCVSALKEWTGKTDVTLLFDSNVDEYTYEAFFASILERPNVAVIATSTKGDVFGGFYHPAITAVTKFNWDPNMFVFSFESRGRCQTPQRFVLKEYIKIKAQVVRLNKTPRGSFLRFDAGPGEFYIGKERSRVMCFNLSEGFEAIENTTLVGQGPNQYCMRVIAVQLS